MNSLPLSYIKYLQHGYLHNQVLFTRRAMRSELLSNISSFVSNSLPLTFVVRCLSTTGSSTISNQLEAGSIMVRAMKSICDELEVDFKPRIKFSADLGGYAEKDDGDVGGRRERG